jgi:hypothetical protein
MIVDDTLIRNDDSAFIKQGFKVVDEQGSKPIVKEHFEGEVLSDSCLNFDKKIEELRLDLNDTFVQKITTPEERNEIARSWQDSQTN